MRIDKTSLIWGVAVVFVVTWMMAHPPEEKREVSMEVQVTTSADQWLHLHRHENHHPETFVRGLFLENKRLSDYRIDRALSAQTISQLRFMAAETGLSEEAAWILLQGCEAFQLDPWMVLALIDIETGGTFRGDLVGSNDDRGYMQITPITEQHLFNRHSGQWSFAYDPEMIFESWYNLTLGMQYLRELADRQDETDWVQVLSEYNRGPDGLRIYFDRHQTVETSYSRRVLERSREWEERYQNNGHLF
ncbi:transglycosylase SLT domain-containing protein [Anoxynatronum buryatiense]|uniref:Transglycosylase SLT domain-containing protein n=1 Tax=Anoxynatronum buryatiense TaxID=489973 RepID=A0AA45WTA5_9CLOT|nr:transglycosylase SLT domain-containing protein [Anoxynatronum buryatiense]SMP40497.1 Transglycosylase SLT domain-containing protein [Anoxynatronum buryatiense]